MLRDGTLIDLCGATLLWRSAVGLLSAPVRAICCAMSVVNQCNFRFDVFFSFSFCFKNIF